MSIDSNSSNNEKRKFSIVIHSDINTANNNYDISQPTTESVKGRRPYTGNLMMLRQPSEIPVIKVRSLSCPTFDTTKFVKGHNKRQSDDAVISQRDIYNSIYISNLKKDLLDFYKQMESQGGHHLEEEVIEEDDHEWDENSEPKGDSNILSSCISNHSQLTPPLETMEEQEHNNSISSDTYYTSQNDTTLSYTTISTEGQRCKRHHHRRPSCAIKFDEPKLVDWNYENTTNDIFKENYSLTS